MAVFASTSSFPLQVSCVFTLGMHECKWQRAEEAILFEYNKTSPTVNELLCMFVKEDNLIRQVIKLFLCLENTGIPL